MKGKFRVESPVGNTFRSALGDGGSVIDLLLLRCPLFVKTDVKKNIDPLPPGEHQIVVAEVHWEQPSGRAVRLVRPAALNFPKARSKAFTDYQDSLLTVDDLFLRADSPAFLDSAVFFLTESLRDPFIRGSKPLRAQPGWEMGHNMELARASKLRKAGRLREARAIRAKFRKEIRSFNRSHRAEARRNLPCEEDSSAARRKNIILGLETKKGASTTFAMRRLLANKLVRDRGELEVIVKEKFKVDVDFKIALSSVISKLSKERAARQVRTVFIARCSLFTCASLTDSHFPYGKPVDWTAREIPLAFWP